MFLTYIILIGGILTDFFCSTGISAGRMVKVMILNAGTKERLTVLRAIHVGEFGSFATKNKLPRVEFFQYNLSY